MAPRAPAGIAHLLKREEGALAPLLERSEWLRVVDARCHALLPPELAGRCRIMNVRANTLLLQADSAAFATRLRYLAPDLLRSLALDPGWQGISRVEVRVRASLPDAPSKVVRKRRLSPQAAALLRSAAAGIEHAPLSRALRRLARHAVEAGNR